MRVETPHLVVMVWRHRVRLLPEKVSRHGIHIAIYLVWHAEGTARDPPKIIAGHGAHQEQPARQWQNHAHRRRSVRHGSLPLLSPKPQTERDERRRAD